MIWVTPMANAKIISFVDAQIREVYDAVFAAKLQPLQLTIARLRKDVDDLKQRERGTPEASAGRETEKINPEE